MINAGLFTSDTDQWFTPPELVAALDIEFAFELDAAASALNHKAPRWFTAEDDGLAQEWTGSVWCNPPYGRGIGAWVAKGYGSALSGATVVMLIPARTDTSYWHKYVMRAAEVRLFRGRLKFHSPGAALNSAPFPSALVVFRPGVHIPRFVACDSLGQVA